jgi:probable rRNA maturation factor
MERHTSGNTSIVRMTKGKLPSLPFVRAKEEILGKNYQLSLAFVDLPTMKSISKDYKGDKTHTNVLSFPLEKDEGEIVMNLQTIRINAKKFDMTYLQHLLFLFIHGCLHLKGYDHGSKMESLEDKYMNKYWK